MFVIVSRSTANQVLFWSSKRWGWVDDVRLSHLYKTREEAEDALSRNTFKKISRTSVESYEEHRTPGVIAEERGDTEEAQSDHV